MKVFDIYFFGQLTGSFDPEAVKNNIGNRFKLAGDKLEKLFSGKPVLIKSGVDASTAGKYRETFRQAGALIDIVPSGQKPVAPKLAPEAPVRETTPGTLKILPLEAGDLSDIARSTPPLEVPAADEFSLSPAGALLPESEPEPVQEIDTSHLEAVPPNSGSLEEFGQVPEPAPIPDISGLETVAPDKGDLSDTAEPVEPAPIPDLDHLEAHASSLEDCVEEKEEKPIPDISDMKLGS